MACFGVFPMSRIIPAFANISSVVYIGQLNLKAKATASEVLASIVNLLVPLSRIKLE